MASSEKLVGEIGKKINELQTGLNRQPWRNASKTVFTNALDKSIGNTQDINNLFENLVENIEKDPKEGSPDLRPFLKETEKLLAMLEKNLKFEKQKKSNAKTVNVLEEEEIPELYADLEQRILGMLLKARYSLERVSIFLRREGFTPLTGNGTAKQVMQILERKEDELHNLREKYEDIRKKSYLGYFEEDSVADLEHELGDIGRKMALSADEVGKTIAFHKSQVEYVENSYAELKQKVNSLEELFFAYSEKSGELIKNLKKERDYAKSVVLDVEHETLQLRNSYTNELLGMQQSRLSAKAEAGKKFEGELKKLQRQISEQNDLINHFKKIAEDKLKKEHNLEEKVKKLSLLLKTKEKHDTVKKQWLKTQKKSKKKK